MLKSSKTINEQHARFVEAARKLGCDESEEAFNEKLKVIAKQKPAEMPVIKSK